MTDGPGRGSHPNSLANLKPFVGGSDPRRQVGGHSAARQFIAFVNELDRITESGEACYPLGELERIVKDQKSPHSKAAASTLLLAARAAGFDKIGRQAKSLSGIKELCDRLLGRSSIEIRVQHSVQRSAAEIRDDICKMLPGFLTQTVLAEAVRADPALLEVLRAVVDGAPVVTSAKVIEQMPKETADAAANNVAVQNIRGAKPVPAGEKESGPMMYPTGGVPPPDGFRPRPLTTEPACDPHARPPDDVSAWF